MQQNKLKPIVYTNHILKRHAPNKTQQLFLLKALQVTQDPQKLKEMIGVKTVADVFRTLDKIAIRKDYHSALEKNGISLDFIVAGIKDIATGAMKDQDRLNAFKTLLKSIGLDDYNTESGSAQGTWEEVLLKKIEENDKTPEGEETVIEEYVVVEPPMPDSVKKAQEADQELSTISIYDSK